MCEERLDINIHTFDSSGTIHVVTRQEVILSLLVSLLILNRKHKGYGDTSRRCIYGACVRTNTGANAEKLAEKFQEYKYVPRISADIILPVDTSGSIAGDRSGSGFNAIIDTAWEKPYCGRNPLKVS